MADPDAGQTSVAPTAVDKAALALDSIATESTAAGRTADDSTGAAASKLSGWDTANALRSALTEWHEQVSALNTRLGQEAGMMRQTHTNYIGIDSALATSFGGR